MANRRKGVLSFDGIRIRPSDAFHCFLDDFIKETTCSEPLRSRIKAILEKEPVLVPFTVIKSVRSVVKQSGTPVSISGLLEGSELCLPNPVTPERNQVLEARIQRLKAQQMHQEYNQMVSNIDQSKRSFLAPEVASDFRDVKKQCLAVVNLLVTIGGTFAFFYKAVEYSLPQPHIPAQVLSGLFASLLVAVAELYFLVKVI
ncbi:uncharacterized protein LOC135399073 [Ornithodoros turicata]|uniref:uncharacterized protein LOC135399073 n=1 Tax=Ornithodoros turicata TaxID=34597 RepID=UPI003139C382